jgi:hypothetical protein
MLDKQLAQKLSPLVNNPELWEALKEFLAYQRNLELQGLVVATSELEVYRRQGKVNSLDNLLKLKDIVNVARKESNNG